MKLRKKILKYTLFEEKLLNSLMLKNIASRDN